MLDIKFKVGRDVLFGKLFMPDILVEKNPAILFIHGWQSKQDSSFVFFVILLFRLNILIITIC
jgi:hypothetical protein